MTRRVCLVGPAYPYRGGIAHFTSLLAKEFQRDCDVFVVNFKRQYPSFLFPGKTQYDESDSPLAVANERIIDSMNPLSFRRAAKAIARYGPNIVVFQWWQPFFALAYRSVTALLHRSASARVVYLCHNVLPHESSPVDRALIRIAFGGVDRFLVQSREDQTNLERLKPGARSVVNPHPIYDVFKRGAVSREEARNRLGLDGNVLLFFGYVRVYKGLGVLIDAFARFLESHQATLLIVGEFYENRDTYDNLLRKHGIESHVRIVDRYVPNEEVETYFAACDVVVLPYLSATQSGIVQVAYGFDKPVIVTAVGGLPDVVEDRVTGLVVPPDDREALARAISEFFDTGGAGITSSGIAAVKERFSWQRCKNALLQVAEA